MRGLSVHVYRDDLGDCTNGGVTSPARAEGKIFVVFDEALSKGGLMSQGNWKLEECKDNPRFVCLRVVRRNLGRGLYLHLEPMFGRPEGMAGPCFGGNYVATSDSRFSEAFGDRPLPVHDRWDTWEDHAILSR